MNCILAPITSTVSIQLMSPASGDTTKPFSGYELYRKVSIQLMSPASGDTQELIAPQICPDGFHSINVPSEWGPQGGGAQIGARQRFPFN